MSALLKEFDRVLGAVGRREARVALAGRRNGPVGQDPPVALLVLAEQRGGEVVAAAVTLAAIGADLRSHGVAPVCSLMAARAMAVTTPVSGAARAHEQN
jgi:hypothetical protein